MNDQGYRWKIVGTYQGNKEVVDYATTFNEAKIMIREYRIAFGSSWTLVITKY